MRKKRLYKIAAVSLAAILFTGCASAKKEQTDPPVSEDSSLNETDTSVPDNSGLEENNAQTETLDEDGVVETVSGKVQGSLEDGVYQYLGIPYAEANERFVPAEPATSWEGIRKADTYGKSSYQGAMLGMAAQNGAGNDNNCQNLNIWTPGINDGKKRAVMVWLHGGGFTSGSANDAMYDGGNLSKNEDVVVVSINHRLNVFGHLDLSAYGEKYKYSGNLGIMDIVDALEWIADNIEGFGGNPENITVFGQSGGGAKVLALMTSPYAEGLFQKGIVQSGATETMGVTFASKEASARITENILKELDISPEKIENLLDVPVEDLLAASDKALKAAGEEFEIPAPLSTEYGMEWGPVVDGDYLPTNPVTEDSFAEAGKDIPLLIGSNLNEWSAFMPSQKEATEEVQQAFLKAYPKMDASLAGNTDTFIRLPMLKIMSHKADQKGADVFSYVFTYGANSGQAYHGAEIPYVFGQADNKLSKQISAAWANFAKNGVPSAEGLPVWESYDRKNGAVMILDTEPELANNHDRQLMQLLEPDYIY